MGKRRTGRKLAFQTLYQLEMRSEERDEIISNFLEGDDIYPETKDFAISLVNGAWDKHQDSDKLIIQYALDWDFDRINIVDKSILRLSFYELNFTETHPNVVLDEAIELAKQFSTDDSPKFINGILGKYLENKCSPESSKK